MWKLWWKSSSSQTKKWQQKLEVKAKTKQNKKQQTDFNILRQSENLLTNRMVTVDTFKKNAVLAKYVTNYWLTVIEVVNMYDRSGKHVANFKCLL